MGRLRFCFFLLYAAPLLMQAQSPVQQLTPYRGDQLKKDVKVVIMDISENDLYYKKRAQYIGLTGRVAGSRLVKNRELWYKGAIKLDSLGKRRFFEEVKISIEILPTAPPPGIADKIASGTRVRILGISESDLYYPNFEKLLQQTGSCTTDLAPNGDTWWSGEIKLDNGYICRFHQVKVEVLP